MEQLPSDVRVRILMKARNDWPDDFEMQKHTIDSQTEAFHELNRRRILLGDTESVLAVFAFAAANWPDDYEMELHTVNSQIASVREFFAYKNPSIPDEVLQQIRLKAFGEWPDDHDMKLHVLKNQVEAWLAINSL